jgi:hypothetical protein
VVDTVLSIFVFGIIASFGSTVSARYGGWFYLAGFLAWFLYLCISNVIGRSIDMKIFHVRIRREADGHPPGLQVGLYRTLGLALNVCALGFGFWWSWRDPKNRAWQDRIAGTVVEWA